VNWYILRALSGQERRVATTIREKVQKEGLDACVEDIVIPSEKVMEVHKGKKVSVNKKFLPGYILIKMEMQDRLWHLMVNIPGAANFLGIKGKPQKVPESEIAEIMKQIETKAVQREQESVFMVGDTVRINDGPFESFTGTVEGVDKEKQKVKVSVVIFGRATPLELAFTQVNKQMSS
jgi:transcriptional antiterminator NusG